MATPLPRAGTRHQEGHRAERWGLTASMHASIHSILNGEIVP